MILTHPSSNALADSKKSGNSGGGWKETDTGDSQSLKLTDDDDENNNGSSNRNQRGGANGGDCFEQALNKQGNYGSSSGHRSAVPQYRVVQVDERVLLSLKPSEVFIVKYPTKALRYRYFKNMIPDIKIHFSPHCRRFFHEEDFEFEYLKLGHCPCCRVAEMEPEVAGH